MAGCCCWAWSLVSVRAGQIFELCGRGRVSGGVCGWMCARASRGSGPCGGGGSGQICGRIGGACLWILSVRGGEMSVMDCDGGVLVMVIGGDVSVSGFYQVRCVRLGEILTVREVWIFRHVWYFEGNFVEHVFCHRR